jgi:hypothetical protein
VCVCVIVFDVLGRSPKFLYLLHVLDSCLSYTFLQLILTYTFGTACNYVGR